MKSEIKSQRNGSVLCELEGTLKLCLETAVKGGADLRSADLHDADLYGADLGGAKGVTKYQTTPLLLLRDQPGPIRAYKLVTEDGIGPFKGGIIYEIGKEFSVADANTDEMEQCGAGINLTTLDWCLKEFRAGYRILVAEFTAEASGGSQREATRVNLPTSHFLGGKYEQAQRSGLRRHHRSRRM